MDSEVKEERWHRYGYRLGFCRCNEASLQRTNNKRNDIAIWSSISEVKEDINR